MELSQAIADTVTVRCMFYNKIHFTPVSADGRPWVTQPFPVLAMICGGSGRIVVADGTETRTVQALWEPCFLASYVMRQPVAAADTGFDVLALGLSVEVLGGISLLNLFDVPMRFAGASRDRMRDLMVMLFELRSAGEALGLERLAEEKRGYFEMLEIIAKKARPKKKGPLLNTEECGCLPAVEYLKEHFASSLDVATLRQMCHLSQSHFFRLFKKLTGVSPFAYLKDRRVEEAQKLLVTTSHSIAEIGERVGWHDPFHFSRIFKSRTGYSPIQYRKQYQPIHSS